MHTNIPTLKTSTKHQVDCTCFNINHMYDNNTGKKQSIDALLKPSTKNWKKALSNELGCLAQGIWDVKENNVIDFITYSEVPKDRIVTYSNMVCNIRPLKTGNLGSD